MKKIHVLFLLFLIALPVIAVAADAVPANDRRKTITASGGETVLDFDFIIEDEDEVAVYENDTLLTLTMDYTVQVSAQTVTLTSAATAADVFVIEGDHPGSRVTQFAIGRLSTSLLNGDFNRLYRILQEIRRDTDRTLQLPKSESGVSTTLPEKDEGKALLWGAAGIENSTVDIASFEDDVAAAAASATAAAGSASTASSAQTAAESAQSAAEDAQAAAEAAVGGIKVSSDDTTPDDLESKLLAGTGLSLSTQNAGGDETRTITPDIASQGEAEAGSAADKLMTPQRTAQAIAALGGDLVIKQVKFASKVDTFTTAATSFTDVTGLSVSITPSDSSHKIMVIGSVAIGNNASVNCTHINLVRDSTSIGAGAAASSRTPSIASACPGNAAIDSVPVLWSDSPSTTSATTYKIQIRANAGSGASYVNRSHTDTDTAVFSRDSSFLAVIEYEE